VSALTGELKEGVSKRRWSLLGVFAHAENGEKSGFRFVVRRGVLCFVKDSKELLGGLGRRESQ